ncbi:hypothetical protein GQR58_023053 [Nymphon striatum]|nr:hypothetical protein GQR58_023053 [Nymphon striatum]
MGVALFAQWSILSNITAGVILFFTSPYKIGDQIRIFDKEILDEAIDTNNIYTIEDIRAFHLHLRKASGELLTYPNNMMLQKAVALVNSSEVGKALYVAAHPDDENTRLISYLSNNTKAKTAYLSLTRGDGGQNLIGPELRELLGVLRTQELLAARRVDGGQQFFSRANDFGYSKHPDETLKIWNKEGSIDEEKFEKADKSKMLNMDVGTYYPILGVSNNEIASLASSQHLCQGFGRLSTRGSQNEYIELLKGDLPKDKNNIFDGIDTSWSRIKGGENIGKVLYAVENNFDFTNPAKHLPELLKAHALIKELSDDHWKTIKLEEIEAIILTVSGLYLEASADAANSNPANNVKVNIEALNRSQSNIVLKSIHINTMNSGLNPNISLENNKKENFEIDLKIPENTDFTSPYWLNEKGTLGTYRVTDPSLIGYPETPRAFHANFLLDFGGYEISFEKPVVYRYARNDKGELYEPFEILPEATARFTHKDSVAGDVQFCFSKGWTVDQETKAFSIDKKGDEQIVMFTLTPPENEDENYITPILRINGKTINKELVTIAYDHVPTQSILLPAETKVVRLNIQRLGENIGYIVGAGDDVPTSLEQIGYNVVTVDPSSIQEGSLAKFDAVVVGIRAYNVVDELKFKQRYLLDYVKNGGNLIVQYNTASRWGKQFENIAPYSLEVSRDRVTDENSEVKILAKDHSLVNFPNPIAPEDFNGWVQERGLYFPD